MYKEQTDAKGGLGYLPGIAEGAYFSYHLFFGGDHLEPDLPVTAGHNLADK